MPGVRLAASSAPSAMPVGVGRSRLHLPKRLSSGVAPSVPLEANGPTAGSTPAPAYFAVKSLSVSYKGTGVAVHEASFECPRGRSLESLAENGAGKSSILKAIGGIPRDRERTRRRRSQPEGHPAPRQVPWRTSSRRHHPGPRAAESLHRPHSCRAFRTCGSVRSHGQ